MAEALQFCELFVLGRPEDIANPGARERMFPALDKKRLIAALRRYRDVHPHFHSGHGLPGLQVCLEPAFHALHLFRGVLPAHDCLIRLSQAVVKRSTIDATIKKLQAEKDQNQ